MPLNDLLVPLDVDVPEIQPDFSAPFFQGFQVIASYILAGAMIVVLIMLVIAGAALAFRGLAPDRVRIVGGREHRLDLHRRRHPGRRERPVRVVRQLRLRILTYASARDVPPRHAAR